MLCLCFYRGLGFALTGHANLFLNLKNHKIFCKNDNLSGETLDTNSLPVAEPEVVQSTQTMAEFGSDLQSQIDLNTSYMDYLEDAKLAIEESR